MNMEIHPMDEKIINDFAQRVYNKKCESFSSFCDWEPYGRFPWVTWPIKLPLNMVQNYKEWDIVKVNCNGVICIQPPRTRKKKEVEDSHWMP